MYLFVFGRDPKISKLELDSFLTHESIEFENVYESTEYVILDFSHEFAPAKIIDKLGGTVRIAKVIHGGAEIDDSFVDSLDFYYPKKYNFAVNPVGLDDEEKEHVVGYLKKKSNGYKARAVQKKSESLPSPGKYFSWKLDEGFELSVMKIKGIYFFAQTLACADPHIYEYLDEARPTQKFTRGTSFRLARMMVNIIGLDKGKTIVDPFCGIGTYLMMGLMAGYDVIGIDNEGEMTNASKKNLDWIKSKYKLKGGYELLTQDAQKADFEADACVFEPYMGPFQKQLPNKTKALKIMNELEILYSQVFDNLADNLAKNAKVVCILPYMNTYDGQKAVLSAKFFGNLKFELVPDEELAESFDVQNKLEYRTPDGSRIGRNLYIFRRK